MSTLLQAPGRPTETEQQEEAVGGRAESQVRLRSRVYLPAFSVAALALVLIALGWSEGWGGENFTGSVTLLRVVLVGPLALVILGCFMVVERIWPAQRRPLFARGHRHDLLLTAHERARRGAPRHGAHPRLRRTGSTRPPMDRSAENRRASSLGGDRRHPRCDGLLQLGGSPGEPQSADVVALSRTPPFPGGHERLDGLSHAPLDPRFLSLGIDSGGGPPFERCTVGHCVDPLWRDGCLCALQHTCWVSGRWRGSL